jgi:hypothetical protein
MTVIISAHITIQSNVAYEEHTDATKHGAYVSALMQGKAMGATKQIAEHAQVPT